MAQFYDKIFCSHIEPPPNGRPEEWTIDIGNNRLVVLCDLCSAKASMEVVRELIRELRLNLTVNNQQ